MLGEPFAAFLAGQRQIVYKRVAVDYPPVAIGLYAHRFVGGDAEPHLDMRFGGEALTRADAQQFLHLAAYGVELVVLGALTPIEAGVIAVGVR